MVLGFLRTTLLGVGGAVGGWLAYSKFAVDHDVELPPAIDAAQTDFASSNAGLLNYYVETTPTGRPLVLLHSINAGASAYEVKPIFEHYQFSRPVYALELPGFGFSDRSDRIYSTDLYVDAISGFLHDVVPEPADVVALSLTSEFAAAAAHQHPDLFNTLTLISPSGFTARENKRSSQNANDNGTSDRIYNVFSNPIWAQAFFDLLVTPASLRLFLARNFEGAVDQGLVDYAYKTTHQLGARYAPLYFVSGQLFSTDIFETAYAPLTVPTLVLYDQDPNLSFDRLPELLETNSAWRARRIPNTQGLPHFERMDKVAQALDEFWSA